MTYASSISCVKLVQSTIEKIVKRDKQGEHETVILSDDPVRLMRQLREANNFLKNMNHEEYGNRYLHLAPLTQYGFKLQKDSVLVRLRSPKALIEEDKPVYLPVDFHTYEPAEDALAAIGYIVEHKNIRQISFPRLSATEIPRVVRWAEKNPEYEVRIQENHGIIVEKTRG